MNANVAHALLLKFQAYKKKSKLAPLITPKLMVDLHELLESNQ